MIYFKNHLYRPTNTPFDQAEQWEWDQTKRYSEFDRWFLSSCGISFNGDVRGLREWAKENNFLQEDTTMETIPTRMTRKAPKLEAAKIEVRRLWTAMCQSEGIPPCSQFVEFSPSNPFQADYNIAMSELLRLRRAREARAGRKAALDSLGMREVRSASGRRYIE